MNDLELMLMLEEYGYEPSIENVKLLKEDLCLSYEDYLDEGVRDAIRTYFDHAGNVKKYKQKYRNAVRTNRAAKQGVKDAEKYVDSHTEHDTGERLGSAIDASKRAQADVDIAKQQLAIAKNRRSNAVSNALHNEPIRKNEEVPMKELVRSGEQIMPHKENDHATSRKVEDEKVAVNACVEYSDYELYQILDESGYKPTENNLSILKEGLKSGKYEIIDEGFHPIKALQTYYSYTKDYVEPNKKNAEIAKKDPKSTEQNINYWQNRYGAAKELRKTATRIALTGHIPEEKSKKD